MHLKRALKGRGYRVCIKTGNKSDKVGRKVKSPSTYAKIQASADKPHSSPPMGEEVWLGGEPHACHSGLDPESRFSTFGTWVTLDILKSVIEERALKGRGYRVCIKTGNKDDKGGREKATHLPSVLRRSIIFNYRLKDTEISRI